MLGQQLPPNPNPHPPCSPSGYGPGTSTCCEYYSLKLVFWVELISIDPSWKMTVVIINIVVHYFNTKYEQNNNTIYILIYQIRNMLPATSSLRHFFLQQYNFTTTCTSFNPISTKLRIRQPQCNISYLWTHNGKYDYHIWNTQGLEWQIKAT